MEKKRLGEEDKNESNTQLLQNLIRGNADEPTMVVIKAGTAGALETLLKESYRILGDSEDL